MLTILPGDCRQTLKTLPDQSVHCVVTSPPYWGLRDYGTGQWSGGAADCDHVVGEMRRGLGLATSVVSVRGGGHKAAECEDIKARQVCPKCGAQRVDQQIGLETTPSEYLAQMVDIFREVRRVLRNDGTAWVNMGDCYAGSGRGPQGKNGCGNANERQGFIGGSESDPRGKRTNKTDAPDGYKAKDLVGMPWRLAFALQADGWYLRSDIVWHKPNPMPESVTDRPTKAHEYIFLLSKRPKYYYDAEAITERCSESTHARLAQNVEAQIGSQRANGGTRADRPMKAVARKLAEPGSGTKNNGSFDAAMAVMPERRNKRTVWTVATDPYREAHFATYPPELIKPCILAGCPAGGTVLDPFGGSGTTGMVALELGRKAILCELNPEYINLIHQRCAVTPGLPLA